MTKNESPRSSRFSNFIHRLRRPKVITLKCPKVAHSTVVQNGLILRHFPTSLGVSEWTNECNRARKWGEWSGASSADYGTSKWVSSAKERANGRASGQVLPSRFLAVLNQCAQAVYRRMFTASQQLVKYRRMLIVLVSITEFHYHLL